ncbi:MAG: nuclear transport factor 2 family protein [Candidatus Pelagadaptatus aseana]|uniref:nuclear transport factor 2 family protein n=1 Tax=Candidatus Pelagadaptatus aseana TaxID=3120508 RepID=UPI0039B2AD88
MNPNTQLLQTFYTSFQKLDGEGMAECYHPDVHFSDPVFPDLTGDNAAAMWKMLCAQARDFELHFHSIEADDHKGRACWEARYCFSATGRKVHNKVTAEFEFQDGKIIKHTDDFSFWKWSAMALGPAGLILGWSSLLKNKVQKQAAKGLGLYSQQ